MQRTEYPYLVPEDDERLTEVSNADVAHLKSVVQLALHEVTGPLLEIGGPTEDGFVSLDGAEIPTGLIISDIEHWQDQKPDQLLDIRTLGFPKQSLGGMAVSALSMIPENPDTLPGGSRPIDWPRLHRGNARLLELLDKIDIGDVSGWNDETIMEENLHVAFLRQARRTIEPGGLLILRLMVVGDVTLAKSLGFEPVAAINPTSLSTSRWGVSPSVHLDISHGETALRLVNMRTSSGLAVEAD